MCTSSRCEFGEGNAALVCCSAGLRRSLREGQKLRSNAAEMRLTTEALLQSSAMAPKAGYGCKSRPLRVW